jgi:hypothetical protein
MNTNVTRKIRIGSYAAACGLLLMHSASLLHAQTPALGESLSGEAKADYEAGRVLYTDGDFAGAALKFTQAYKKSNDARLLWNVAAARKSQRRYAEVERLLKQYLSEAKNLPKAESERAKELLQTIDAFVADVTLTVNEAGAQIWIDEVEVGTAPLSAPLRIDLGKHQLRVSKPGFEPHGEVLELTNDTTVSINLQPAVYQGRLRILSPAKAEVYVDGKRVTGGSWEGTLASGSHRVEVHSPGNAPYRVDAVVRDTETTTLQVTAQDLSGAAATPPPAETQKSSATWLWWTLGVLVVGGAAAGGYFLFKPDPAAPAPIEQGTIGTVEL